MLNKKIIKQKSSIFFENILVRRIWSDKDERWYFAIMDVVRILTQSANPRNYWKVLKNRFKKEGSELVTKCNQLKLIAKDGSSLIRIFYFCYYQEKLILLNVLEKPNLYEKGIKKKIDKKNIKILEQTKEHYKDFINNQNYEEYK